VTIVSVDRVFLAMKYLKRQLYIKMRGQWLNDRLVTFIETYVLIIISNDVILSNFH